MSTSCNELNLQLILFMRETFVAKAIGFDIVVLGAVLPAIIIKYWNNFTGLS